MLICLSGTEVFCGFEYMGRFIAPNSRSMIASSSRSSMLMLRLTAGCTALSVRLGFSTLSRCMYSATLSQLILTPAPWAQNTLSGVFSRSLCAS